MRTSIGVLTLAVGLGAWSCGVNNSTSQMPSATRTGPGCDSIVSRLARGDTTIKVVGPLLRGLVMPPLGPPADLKGKAIVAWFTITPSARTIVDSLSGPQISSVKYRADLMRGLEAMVFTPAVAEGCAVPGRHPLTITF